jgi:hypothetical protein
MRSTVLGAVILLETLAAGVAGAKDPCPPVPPEDVQACVELGKRTQIPLEEKTGVVAMDDSAFYVFQEAATGDQPVRLIQVPIAGGPSVVLSNEVGAAAPDDSFDASPVVIGASQVFWWKVEDGIFSAPKRGGEVSSVYDAAAKPEKVFDLVSDGHHLYWANSAKEIWQKPLAGGAPKRLARRPNDIRHLVASGGKLLWLEGSDRTLKLVSMETKTGRVRTTALEGQADDDVLALAADDRSVYLGTFKALKRMPLAGGPLELLVSQSAERVVPGTSSVFYVPYKGDCGGGHLMKVPKAGGAPTEVERCPSIRNFMAHDSKLFFLGPKGLGSVPE